MIGMGSLSSPTSSNLFSTNSPSIALFSSNAPTDTINVYFIIFRHLIFLLLISFLTSIKMNFYAKTFKLKYLKNQPPHFQYIQRTADRVARGAGSAFRVVAGTESLDSALKNFNSDTDVQSNDDDQLKADSSETRSARSGDLSLVKILFVELYD